VLYGSAARGGLGGAWEPKIPLEPCRWPCWGARFGRFWCGLPEEPMVGKGGRLRSYGGGGNGPPVGELVLRFGKLIDGEYIERPI
jgi:hypothetical protein